MHFPQSKYLMLFLALNSSVLWAEECSFLSGWEGQQRVLNLSHRIGEIFSAGYVPNSGANSDACRKSVSEIIVAYESIKDLGRKEYKHYYNQQISLQFKDNPLHKKFSFLSKYILSGQVQSKWQEYKSLLASGGAGLGEAKEQLRQFILNKYNRLATDQRRTLPDGPIIIPLSQVSCVYRSRPINEDSLSYIGRSVPSGSYCASDTIAPLDEFPYPYQSKATTIGFEIEGNKIMVRYCEQENGVEKKTTGVWPFVYTRHVINSQFSCVTYDMASKEYSLSDKDELDLSAGFSRNVNENIDKVAAHYATKLQANPNMPDKIMDRDTWWTQQKETGKVPSFRNFFNDHYPAWCSTQQASYTITTEERHGLDVSPAFWHYDIAGVPRPD